MSWINSLDRLQCMLLIAILGIATVSGYSANAAENGANKLTIDDQREETLKELSRSAMPDIAGIKDTSKKVFSKPLDQQSSDELKSLASDANYAANLVGMIEKKYDDYLRENYRYDFIKDKAQPVRFAYTDVSNALKSIRNRAYLNLGEKAKNAGDMLKAFLYFRDAYRLSTFDCGPGKSPESCIRWLAEQEMQKLLQLSHIKAYVSWK